MATLFVVQPAWGITPANPEVKAPLASSFPGPLWQVVAPVGGTASASGGHLMITVPAGSNHDALHGANAAVRVVQPIGNVDFDVSIKVDSAMVAADHTTSQGLMVVMDDKNLITFGLDADGTNIDLDGQSVNGGVATALFENRNFREYQIPIHLRLTRTGQTYVTYYSVDGAVWVQCGTFVDPRVPTWIGPFASNYNETPSRAAAFVMAINWFNTP